MAHATPASPKRQRVHPSGSRPTNALAGELIVGLSSVPASDRVCNVIVLRSRYFDYQSCEECEVVLAGTQGKKAVECVQMTIMFLPWLQQRYDSGPRDNNQRRG